MTPATFNKLVSPSALLAMCIMFQPQWTDLGMIWGPTSDLQSQNLHSDRISGNLLDAKIEAALIVNITPIPQYQWGPVFRAPLLRTSHFQCDSNTPLFLLWAEILFVKFTFCWSSHSLSGQGFLYKGEMKYKPGSWLIKERRLSFLVLFQTKLF